MNTNFKDYNFKDMSCNSFIDLLLSLDEYELAILGTIIGFYLSSITTINQQNALGNFFELIGQIMLTIYSQTVNLESFNDLNSKINKLEKELNEIKKRFH